MSVPEHSRAVSDALRTITEISLLADLLADPSTRIEDVEADARLISLSTSMIYTLDQIEAFSGYPRSEYDFSAMAIETREAIADYLSGEDDRAEFKHKITRIRTAYIEQCQYFVNSGQFSGA